MAAAGRQTGSRRKTGAALGYDASIVYVQLRCGQCQSFQTEPFDEDRSLPGQVKGVSCMFCGRAGCMRTVRGN